MGVRVGVNSWLLVRHDRITDCLNRFHSISRGHSLKLTPGDGLLRSGLHTIHRHELPSVDTIDLIKRLRWLQEAAKNPLFNFDAAIEADSDDGI